MQLKSFFSSYPKGVLTIAFSNLWDTFSYYGTQTILVLFLIHTFKFGSGISYLIYGTYVAMSFSTPILGGIIADRFLGARYTLLLGAAYGVLGNLMLMFDQVNLFYIGLAITLIGSGLYKCNSTQILGSLYREKLASKEKGFTLLYLSINVGGTLAPLIYGLVVYKLNWTFGFLVSANGILISLVLLLKNVKLWPTTSLTSLSKRTIGVVGSLLAIGLLTFSFMNAKLMVTFPLIVFALGIGYLVYAIRKTDRKQRKSLFNLLMLCFFAMFYFSAGMQVGTTITLFIQNSLKNLTWPASTFSMLYSGFVLMLAPIAGFVWAYLKNRKMSPRVTTKIAIGIILGSIGIFAFAIAAKTTFVLTSIVTGYIFLSAGELVITPAIYTVISNNSPENLKGVMIGCWFLFIGMGSYLTGIFSHVSKLLFAKSYFEQFIFIGIIPFIAAILLLCLSRTLNQVFIN